MNLREWAVHWNVPFAAIVDLETRIGLFGRELVGEPRSEAYAQSAVRLEAAQRGILLFRNNVGVLQDDTGRPVRYGLANDSPAMNKRVKSGDLIGVEPVTITPAHVGTVIGQFVSRECKPEDWRFTANEHETAQLAFINLINAKGGNAKFATGLGSFE